MRKRWNKGRALFIFNTFLLTSLSVSAFLESLPSAHPTVENHRVLQPSVLRESKNEKENQPEFKRFASFFSGSKKEEVEKKDTESPTGLLKSFSKWRESRKIRSDSEKQEKEASDFRSNKFGLTSNLRRFESGPDDLTKENTEKKTGIAATAERERIRLSQGGVNDSERKERPNVLSVAQKFVSNVIKQKSSKEEWVVVASKTSIAPGAIVPITAAGLDLLLVASKDGSALHCVANSCPHLGTPLEIGTLDRRPIEYDDSGPTSSTDRSPNLRENYISKLLTQDGCEDCIVCPLHKTAFALESGEVRGEWCPYPPVVGKMVGTIKTKSNLPVFDVRTKGKNIEVRLNTPIKVYDET